MIVLQFDDRYHHWGELMLRSLALHEPGERVLADVVNLRPEQVEEISRAHPKVIVRTETAVETTPELMINRKCFILQRVMNEHPREPWYCLFDADFLVRRPLRPLWALMHRFPVALILTNGMWQGRVYQHLITPSGIVMVRPDGRELIESWVRWQSSEEAIAGIQPGAWYWDQVTLLRARDEACLDYAVIPMQDFADCELRADSAIWSANVDRREKDLYFRWFSEEHERQIRRRE
ncbi:MAG TPA: hypothetical protein VF173_37920 [Thermoanaerobaculia bacterium]|nr:hypothetical protein [Thermoanaerobaculia bacterium]